MSTAVKTPSVVDASKTFQYYNQSAFDLFRQCSHLSKATAVIDRIAQYYAKMFPRFIVVCII